MNRVVTFTTPLGIFAGTNRKIPDQNSVRDYKITAYKRTVCSNETCDPVRTVIANLWWAFQIGHLLILVLFIIFVYIQPILMIAETRFDNNCSLIIAKCGRKGLRRRRLQDALFDHGEYDILLRLSVSQMYFPIIISIKRQDSLILWTRKSFPSPYTTTL